MNEVELLKNQVSKFKAEILERKADEEMRMNEKIKEFNQLQRQFHDVIVQEQESKLRLGQAQQERLNKLQEELKNELDKCNASHAKEIEQMESKYNRLRDEKATGERENAKVLQQRN